MKRLVLPAIICLLTAVPATAAEFFFTRSGDVATFYLNAGRGEPYGGNLNGKFDSVYFNLTTAAGTTLTNIVSGVGRLPGEPFSFRNRVLDADPLDGGLGWSILGGSITPTLLTFGGGPLGGTIDTSNQPGGNLFLANVRFSPAAGSFGGPNVQLLSAGMVIADMPAMPEPSAGVLGVFALVAVRAARPRRGRRG